MKQTAKNVSPMSNEVRNAYVTQHLTDAMLTLLKRKPIHEISISELCDLAGVGRASFYRNYESREAIVTEYLKNISREWADEYIKEPDMPLNRLIHDVFAHLENHLDFYRCLSGQHLVHLLKDVLTDILGPKPEQTDAATAYATAFVTYTLYGWIEVWFQRGMQETAAEMAELFRAHGL